MLLPYPGLQVHMNCFGVTSLPDGKQWLCDLCRLGVTEAPACALCPVVGSRTMKPTADHR